MELTAERVEGTAERYRDKVDGYQQEVEELERLPAAFADGTWTLDDVEYILRWKALKPFEDKAGDDFRRDPERKIEQIVSDVVSSNSVVQKVERLVTLNGVRVPIASAILVFMNPRAYTVVDTNAWQTLYDAGYLYDEVPDRPDTDDYLRYLGVCHSLATEFGVGLRKLDRGLWVLGSNSGS